MTIRYVLTNGNKYLQYRLMAQNFTNDTTQWQGVDDKPTDRSENLVKSGGVADVISDELYNYTEQARVSYSQTGYNSGYKSLYLNAGKTYRLRLTATGFDTHPNALSVILCPSQSTTNNLNITDLFGGSARITSREEVFAEITTDRIYWYIRTSYSVSSYSPSENNNMLIIAEEVNNKFDKCLKIDDVQVLTSQEKENVINKLTPDEEPLEDSNNLVRSGGVKKYVDDSLYNEDIISSISREQTIANMPYDAFSIQAGETYQLTLQITGLYEKREQFSGISLYSSQSGSALVENITSLFGTLNEIFSGKPKTISYTPQSNVRFVKITFNGAYINPENNNISLIAVQKTSKLITEQQVRDIVQEEINVTSILKGKKVLMLGDSITQLPRTSYSTTGKGIVEYFSELTGATVIRGAVGGSHLRTRRTVNSVEDIIDVNYAKATTDISKIVEQLIAGDFTLARAGLAYSGGDSYVLNTIIPDLESLDMSTVDILTIFGGTNDYANNVPLGEADSDNKMIENGALNYMLEALTTAYLNLSVFVFTPIVKKPGGIWCEDIQNSQGLKLSDYGICCMDAAKRFMIPACDLYHEMGINQYNFYNYISSDNTHPTDFGFRSIARKMASFIIANYNRY